MTSSTTHTQTATQRAADAGERIAGEGRNAVDGFISAGRAAVDDVTTRLPDAASAARNAVLEAEHRISTGSDPMVAFGAALSFGFVAGLVVGGANRVLIALALVPAASFGSALVGRLDRSR